MKYRYIIIDAELNTTGIRDEYLGEIKYSELNLPSEFIKDFSAWLSEYQEFNFIKDSFFEEEKGKKIKTLDEAGIRFVFKLKLLLPYNPKVEYYSDALQQKILF